MPKSDSQKSKLTNIGSLWRTRGGSSSVVATGKLQMEGRDGPEISVMLFKNDKEGNERRPDFRLVMVEEEDEKPAPKKGKAKGKVEDDDTPF